MSLRRLAIFSLLSLSGCLNFGGVDLAPNYEKQHFVVPDSWHGSGPFVEANPSDAALRKDWWTLFNDPALNTLEEQVAKSNPNLQAAAERFVQARDEMMKLRSQLIPQLGVGVGAASARQSVNTLFRPPNAPITGQTIVTGGLASWEPDFWSQLRNATRAQIYRAQEAAAEYALARLSLQAELAGDYFVLRGLDARDAIYRQSIEYYRQSLNIVTLQFRGALASELDVARAEFILASTQAKQFGVQGQRQVIEHAIAILVNQAPTSFSIAPKDQLEVSEFPLPVQVPSRLLERRPDVAAMEREMAQANRGIGMARAAFFPNVGIGATGGFEGTKGLFELANSFWSYGATVQIPLFQGGYLRAQLQQAWSAYRETEDRYRATVLNAFREVQDGLSLTNKISSELERQRAAIAAATKQQDLSMQLFKGGLASSLDLLNAQLNTLESRISAAELKAELLKSVVQLMRALGGGWDRSELPKDREIQPFGVFRAAGDKPTPVGGIDVDAERKPAYRNLTQPVNAP